MPYISKELITRNEKGLITEVVFTLSDGTTITAGPCGNSWEQWGASTDKLWITSPRLDELNPEMDHE